MSSIWSRTRKGTEVIFVKQTKVRFMCPISELTWVSTQGQSLISFFCFEAANFRTVQTIKGWIVVYLLIWAEHAKEQKSFSLTKPRWHLYAPVLSWLGFQLKGKPWFLFSCFETAISKLSKQLRVKLSSIYFFGLQRLLYPH